MDNVMAVMTTAPMWQYWGDEVTLMTVSILMMMTSMIYLLTCGRAHRAHYNDLWLQPFVVCLSVCLSLSLSLSLFTLAKHLCPLWFLLIPIACQHLAADNKIESDKWAQNNWHNRMLPISLLSMMLDRLGHNVIRWMTLVPLMTRIRIMVWYILD